MALPSQNARPISRRAHMHRRRRSRRTRAIGLGVGAVVLLLAGWWVTTEMFGAEDPTRGGGLVTGVGTVPDGGLAPATGAETGATEKPIAPRKKTAERTPTRTPKTARATPPPSVKLEMPEPQEPVEKRAAPAGDADVAARAANGSPTDQPGRALTTSRAPVYTPASTPGSAGASGSRTARRVATGLDLLARDEPVKGRRVLTDALNVGDLDDRDARTVRDRLSQLNERLVFSPEVVADDPFTLTYTVKSGDLLSRVPRMMGLLVDWRFIQHVNRIDDPKRVRVGQRLKLVTGPFHAVVHKRDYRLDLYLGDGVDRVYVRSFPVGLGEYNSTPEGRFRVRENSKLIDPEWINPRTRQRYAASDPANPIGEYWIGLNPDDERLEGVEGYGIHGTIEPDSIGRQASMGCVRMLPDDIRLVWGMLNEGISTVEIVD